MPFCFQDHNDVSVTTRHQWQFVWEIRHQLDDNVTVQFMINVQPFFHLFSQLTWRPTITKFLIIQLKNRCLDTYLRNSKLRCDFMPFNTSVIANNLVNTEYDTTVFVGHFYLATAPWTSVLLLSKDSALRTRRRTLPMFMVSSS